MGGENTIVTGIRMAQVSPGGYGPAAFASQAYADGMESGSEPTDTRLDRRPVCYSACAANGWAAYLAVYMTNEEGYSEANICVPDMVVINMLRPEGDPMKNTPKKPHGVPPVYRWSSASRGTGSNPITTTPPAEAEFPINICDAEA